MAMTMYTPSARNPVGMTRMNQTMRTIDGSTPR
jgi:hypothetical protein